MSRFALVTLLTFGRAPLALLGAACSLAVLALPSPAFVAAAAALLALSGLTDLLDGRLARRWGVTSRLGALADPLMDKVFYAATLPAATFLALANEDFPHAWSLLALDVASLLRDQLASFLRAVGSEFGADVRASWSGKVRTFFAFPAIVLVHVFLGMQAVSLRAPAWEGWAFPPWVRPALFAAEAALLALVVWSGADYTARFLPFLRRAARPDAGAGR